MYTAALYEKKNQSQRKDSLECMQKYSGNIRWKREPAIADIGSGGGSVTTTVLQKFIPSDYKMLVGLDVGEDMVQYANKNHSSHKTTFKVFDIEQPVPKHLIGKFDHVFSFNVFNNLKDLKRRFRGVFDIMSEGGSCLVMFVNWHPILAELRELAMSPKWRPLVNENSSDLLSQYFDLENPEEQLKIDMEDIGFKNVNVDHLDKSYTFDTTKDMKDLFLSYNHHGLQDETKLIEFIDDLESKLHCVKRKQDLTISNDVKKSIICSYKVLVASGTK